MPAPTRRAALRAAAAAAALLLPLPAAAQTAAPPVRLLVGFAPGGASDAAARLLQPRLAARLGQPVVVENRPGAGGNLAAEAVARAAPDGLTLLLANLGTLAVNPALVRAMPFDPQADLAPLSLAFAATNLLVAPANRPFRSLADLLAAARARPEALTYGTGGVGAPGHLGGILLDHLAGTRTTAVPYRGGGPQMTALLAGEHDFAFSPLGTALPHIRTGTVRALAVATRERAPELPDLPTVAEAGLPGFELTNWDGVLAPRATPAPIRARLGDALRAALSEGELREEFARRGLTPTPSTEEEFARRIAEDSRRWQALLRAAGIQPE